MEKINYFGMYLGAKVETPDGVFPIIWLGEKTIGVYGADADFYFHVNDCTLLLRSLSSLTDEEKVGWYDVVIDKDSKADGDKVKIYFVDYWIKSNKFSPASFTYLLSLHIDLFQLAEKGWAKIDNAKYVDNGKLMEVAESR